MEIIESRKKIAVVLVLFIIVLFSGGIKYYALRINGDDIQTEISIEQPEPLEMIQSPVQEEKEEVRYAVHIIGAVKKPGVYFLEEGSRLDEAVLLALPEEDADLSKINLALLVEDESQIYVPKLGENTEKSTQLIHTEKKTNGLVNINKATKAELDSLPGIGPVLAERIIIYRENNGKFNEIEDVTKVSGIGKSLFGKISSKITVN